MSPRSVAANERLRDESRRVILEHALVLFSSRGYDATTMKMIAEAAGISPGLIYHYFDGKERLLEAIFEESMRDVARTFVDAEAAPTADARIDALLRSCARTLREHLAFWRLSYATRMQGEVLAVLGDRVPQWTQGIRATLARWLREAGAEEPEREALVLFALIDGVSQHYALDPERYPLDDVMERIAAAYRRSGGRSLFPAAERD